MNGGGVEVEYLIPNFIVFKDGLAVHPSGQALSKEEVLDLIDFLKERHLQAEESEIKQVGEFHSNEIKKTLGKGKEKKSYVVYFALASSHLGDDMAIKVGCTSNIESRIKSLNAASLYKIKNVVAMETEKPFLLERELHEMLSEYKLENEWFIFNESFVEALNRHDDFKGIATRLNNWMMEGME
mgnify:CR=1 FL=1